ncbi:TetR family transcriptional regulator [Jatrophihabitans sp. GAS493]|uniref:TetR/AcrR family transcriptional regulator n=1 Tax=Jatrophihabitans sp. GAS493 TaxID=1907575 RepID=UPI000BC0C46D|nr:TetR/AcrR family transcriptional regulator [Jatrophihabitans sp. GAS493]SOD71488.1 TetR family transcriptional regulator [Jatrophihabitans sp. GAS493]
MPTRTRMSVAARRRQLVQIGVELLSTRPYDDVWVEMVADRAGVSRGLLYHYFPTKRDFVAAVVSDECTQMLELIETEPKQTVTEQLYHGLDVYLAYVQEHRLAYRMLHQGALTNDREIRRIIGDAMSVQEERILQALQNDAESGSDEPSAMVRLAVRGWLAFTIAICLDWLDESRPSAELTRQQVRELCAQSLLSAVAAARVQQ